jgi:nucleoside-diphosphate-sugar epimerase
MKPRILICGAATLVGAEMLRQLCQRSDIEKLLVAVPDQEPGKHDLQSLEGYLGQLPSWITPVTFDPTRGLGEQSLKEFASSFDFAFHCQQRSVRDDRMDSARAANVRPAANWIEILKANPELHLHYLSTAFVAGTRQGLFTEFDFNCGQGFNDAWERTMFEAEVLLRASEVSERVTAYRPSHILGHADSGEAFRFEGAYPLIATLASSSVLPGDPPARIDLVPVDFVSSAMIALADDNATGTFHLACGWRRSISIREAVDLAAKGKGRASGARLLPRGVAWPARIAGTRSQKSFAAQGGAFKNARHLLHQGPVFDTYLADLVLSKHGIDCPSPADWLENAVRVAESRAWAPGDAASLQ